MSIPKHFLEATSTVKDVSYDDSNKIYMSDSGLVVYDFDKIKDWYASTLAGDGNKLDVESNDALYIDDDNVLFIEFKNGNIDRNKDRNALKRKIYDSCVIISDDITNTKSVVPSFRPTAGFMRENVDYILVYNGEKNPPSKKNVIRHGYISKGKGQIPARFGISRFEGYLFRKVRTYTEQEFQINFVEKMSRGEAYV